MKTTNEQILFARVLRLSDRLNRYISDPLNQFGSEIETTAKKFNYILGQKPSQDMVGDIEALKEYLEYRNPQQRELF